MPGLSEAEAGRRRAERGPNRIARRRRQPAWRLLLAQFASPLVLVLVLAAIVAAAVGDIPDAVAIAVIVSINAVIGFVQEARAARDMAALQSLTARRATVLRDEHERIIAAEDVAVGDVLVLRAGDVVAADARLLEANRLAADEAALTGESAPIDKSSEPCPKDTPLAERRDRVFMGTTIATGTGLAEVDAVGMETEVGKIAALVEEGGPQETPLQRRLAAVGRQLLIACLAVVAVVAALGVWRGLDWLTIDTHLPKVIRHALSLVRLRRSMVSPRISADNAVIPRRGWTTRTATEKKKKIICDR